MRVNYYIGDTVRDIHTKHAGIVIARQKVQLSANLTDFSYTVLDDTGKELYYMGSHALVLYEPNDTHNKPKE